MERDLELVRKLLVFFKEKGGLGMVESPNAPGHRAGVHHVQRRRWRFYPVFQRRHPHGTGLADRDVLHRAARRPELRPRDPRPRPTFCSQATRPFCARKELATCQALHFPIPANWKAPNFDDSRWPTATTWPPAVVTDDPVTDALCYRQMDRRLNGQPATGSSTRYPINNPPFA